MNGKNMGKIKRGRGEIENKKEKDVILINKMLNSNKEAYANEGQNIVHEMINLFKAHNGKHYIYVVKDGHINKKYDDRVSDILLTRSVGNKCVEIIAWVKEPKQIIKNWDSKKRKNIYDTQMKKYVDEMRYDVNYKVAVNEIFGNNFYKEKKENEDDIIYATFETNIVLKPKKPIYLTYDNEKEKKYPKNTFCIERKNFNQSQKAFVVAGTKDYNKLTQKVLKKENWEEKDTFEEVNIENFKGEDNFNFLKLIKLENFELAFSNMFQYYFLKNKNIFQKFAKNILGIDINVNDKSFEINREEQHIDILIRDNNKVIVIENKIKSDINGKQYDEYGNVIKTQLEAYKKYIKDNEKDKNKDEKDKCFYIFAPNYSKDKFLDNHKGYKVITYKEIYDFYKDNEEYFKKDQYFKDFLKALKKHTKEVDSEIYDIMLDRLSKRIIEIRDNKN